LAASKLSPADRVGQQRERAAIVHRGLRALGAQLVDDRGQLLDLRLVEPELPRQEAQRSPHAETAGGIAAPEMVMREVLGGAPRSRSRSPRDARAPSRHGGNESDT
jgi:hypothetical protein